MLCMHHVDRIKSVLGISGVKTFHYPWASTEAGREAQIDLVIERDDRITDLCELKYTDRPFSISKEYEQNLLKKRDLFREITNTRQTLRIVLISAAGVAGTAHREHISDIITLDDLFE